MRCLPEKSTVVAGLLLLTALAVLCPDRVLAREPLTLEAGVRGGTDSARVEENYFGGELYVLKDLPWRAEFGDEACLKARLDGGLGYLNAASEPGIWVAAGADLVLVLNPLLALEVGFRPTLLSDHEYGADDFGGALQFASHVGLDLAWRRVVLSYRLQHMSNADLYSANPGLNLHLVGLGYRF